MVEVLTPVAEQIATVTEFMNLRWSYEPIYIVPYQTNFWAHPLQKVSERMVKWYLKSPYDGGWVSKNRWYLINLPKDICVFWKYFSFWSICRLFHIVFIENVAPSWIWPANLCLPCTRSNHWAIWPNDNVCLTVCRIKWTQSSSHHCNIYDIFIMYCSLQ